MNDAETLMNVWSEIFAVTPMPWKEKSTETRARWEMFFATIEVRMESRLTLRWRKEVDKVRQELYELRKRAGVRKCTCGATAPHGPCSHEDGCPMAEPERGGTPNWKSRAETAEKRVQELQGNYGDGFKAGMACERNDVVQFLFDSTASHLAHLITKGEHSTVKLRKRELLTPDWTTDPESGRANSSELFNSLVKRVSELIRNSAYTLLCGYTETTASLIMAQLAHVHHLSPKHEFE